MNRALSIPESTAYLLVGEGLALMRLVASSASSTVVTRAASLFVSTYNTNAAALRDWMRSVGSPLPVASLVMQPWSSQIAEVITYTLQAFDVDQQVASDLYQRMPQLLTSPKALQDSKTAVLAMAGELARVVSNDRDPMPELVSELVTLMTASPYNATAVTDRTIVSMRRTTASYEQQAQSAATTALEDTRKIQDRIPGATRPVTVLEDPNAYQVTAQRPGRQTAIPAAVWVIGVGVLVGGIGMLVVRKAGR